MRLDERMNLVIPLYRDTSEDTPPYAYVHSSPISRESFEEHYLLLAKTFASIFGENLAEASGPRVAALVLNDIARKSRAGNSSVDGPGLMNEIRRISFIIMKMPNGKWESFPYDSARADLDPDDISEVENSLVFFIVLSSMLPRRRLADILPGAVTVWGAQTSFLNFTDFRNSLQTSIVTAASPETTITPALPMELIPGLSTSQPVY